MSNKIEISTFSIKIETLVKEKNLSYMDAIVYYCEKFDYEIEIAAKLLSGSIRSKIKLEAEELNFLPKSNTFKLPL